MQQLAVFILFQCKISLQVSGALCTHHQEYLKLHHSVTVILAEQTEIFKPALAATFKFAMAIVLPVTAHYFLPMLVSPLGFCILPVAVGASFWLKNSTYYR
jgi:hypothetical protein